MAAMAIPEVRKRIQYVFLMFGVFVLGLHIPVPGVDRDAMGRLFQDPNLGILNLFDTFSGGAFRKFTIFALGITPYINASIIMQLMTVAVPQLEQMAKEGESGRKQIAKYTRYLTAALAVLQAFGLITMLSHTSAGGAIFVGGWLTRLQVVVALTAGTTFLMWMGEQITEKGIGQGVSLIIFASIMARLPFDVARTYMEFGLPGSGARIGPFNILALLVLFMATVVGIIYVHLGTRRVPIQHARRTVGRQVIQASSSFLPFKVNTAGVIPIIFAISLLMFPATIASYFNNPMQPTSLATRFARTVIDWTTPGQPGLGGTVASLVYAALIFAFTYFYAAIVINIPELTENLKKHGSFIPGIRPGRPTQEYLDRVVTRLTFAGAIFIAVVGLLQYYTGELTGVTTFTIVGGTSILIVVGVALDTMQQLESHLVMRNYEGFIRSTGRRPGGAARGSLTGVRLS
jgi:preprotein translocase subunit SecY